MKLFNESNNVVLIKTRSNVLVLQPYETLLIHPNDYLVASFQEQSYYKQRVEKRRKLFFELFEMRKHEVVNELHLMIATEYAFNDSQETVVLKSRVSDRILENNHIVYYHYFEFWLGGYQLLQSNYFIMNKELVENDLLRTCNRNLKKEVWFRFFNFPPIKKHFIIYAFCFCITTSIFKESLDQQEFVGSMFYLLIIFLLVAGYIILRYRCFLKEVMQDRFSFVLIIRKAIDIKTKK